MEKTYKREVASIMLAFLAIMYVWGVYNPSSLQVAEYLTTPVFLFVAGAFGMDAYSKQVTNVK